jgi:hypothetical protein
MAGSARQNELVQLQTEITNEVTGDAPHIARMVFGDNASHPDITQVSNDRLDALYRQKFLANDRPWLQAEARRDPEQFLKVADRIGVQKPPPAPPPPPPAPALPPAGLPTQPSYPSPPLPPPPAAVVAPTVPVPAPGALAPAASPPPLILGPNGLPLPPSGLVPGP